MKLLSQLWLKVHCHFLKKIHVVKKKHQLKPKVKQDNYVESVSCGTIYQEHSPIFGKNYHYSC